jgi:histidine ammonia-lyase
MAEEGRMTAAQAVDKLMASELAAARRERVALIAATREGKGAGLAAASLRDRRRLVARALRGEGRRGRAPPVHARAHHTRAQRHGAQAPMTAALVQKQAPDQDPHRTPGPRPMKARRSRQPRRSLPV